MRRSAACPSLLTIANLAWLGDSLSVTCATESGTWILTCIDPESWARAVVAMARTRLALATRLDFMENSGRKWVFRNYDRAWRKFRKLGPLA
jgi:hypothetical protein